MIYDRDALIFRCTPEEAVMLGGHDQWVLLSANSLASRIAELARVAVSYEGKSYVEFTKAVHQATARRLHMVEVFADVIGPLLAHEVEYFLTEQTREQGS